MILSRGVLSVEVIDGYLCCPAYGLNNLPLNVRGASFTINGTEPISGLRD